MSTTPDSPLPSSPPPGTPPPSSPPPAPPGRPPAPAAPSAPSGWFPDPNGRHEFRYFNGQRWTADVSDQGQRSVDPLGAGPTPGGAPALSPNPAPRGNGTATAAMVCGIIGVLLAWMPFLVVAGLVLAVLALVFGIQARRRANASGIGGGRSTAGIVLGAIGVALSVLGIALSVLVYREVVDFIDAEPHVAEVTSCTVTGGVADVRGTITNLADEHAEFTLFVKVRGESRVFEPVSAQSLPTIAPGATAEWSSRVLVRESMTECAASVDVYGPFPFGVEIDEP